ncbi:DEAD/DEAH box helicase [Rhodococcus sp. IEGM 1305]|uniref:DEAD/DEAH box helicase n=1 Tax=Rhodococcus sp. IEGM 1305 TaxID=3047092 RepID=UPI0024B766AE|nr:DEAD/DEAH box helicase [Rhodococcus sp. IEGM 1305]MDI9952873.1 DEAD/DEAH box helicase [Rhodococcus sp. IEGM 1305]
MNMTNDSDVLRKVAELTELALRTYALNPARIEEDANGERRIHQGGYGDRQIFELVQNAADELRAPEHRGGRIHVALTEEYLYCANEGTPVTPEGTDTILRMGVSKKRGGQIGRFGVGVKSVLSVSQAPQIFSKTGSFGFDAKWSEAEILAAVNGAQAERGEPSLDSVGETPVLRMARPLDVSFERSRDSVLDSMLGWASTVVRLPLVAGAAERLGRDIQQSSKARVDESKQDEFPHLFQLFSPHVGSVVLEDRRDMPVVRREIQVGESGHIRTIHQSRTGSKAVSESYRVFTLPHRVSDETRRRAGELHDRVTIDISWAVPNYTVADGSDYHTIPNDRGTFWSYFPTKYPMTLSGALNAAWKTNEDRQNLLDSSDLNAELLNVAARLVVGSLENLTPVEDPAAFLPLLPGRPKESPNWACRHLTEEVWLLAAKSPSLPDQRGDLRLPTGLRIHKEKLSPQALALWREYPGRPVNWVHHSVEGPGSRRGKMNHILEAASCKEPETVRAWLEALVEDRTAAASAAAIRVLAHMLVHDLAGSNNAADAVEARKARIVLTESGTFVAPAAGSLFRRSSDDGLRDDLVYVDTSLSDDPELVPLLDRLGIRESDTEGRFHSVLDQGFAGYTDESWTRFWELLNSAGGPVQAAAVRQRVNDLNSTLHVKTVTGKFAPLKACMLPGPIVPADGSRDGNIAVDMSFHANDRSILRSFGMSDRPDASYKPDQDGWFELYRKAMYDQYCSTLGATRSRIQITTMKLDGGAMAGPLHLFKRLSDEGRAAFITEISDDGLIENWTRQIGQSANTRVQILSPIRWLIGTHGMVRTTQGLRRVREAVGPQLSEYGSVLPVAEISQAKARKLRMPTAVEDVEPARWNALLEKLKESTDDNFVGRTYALLIRIAYDLVFKEEVVRCRVGDEWELRVDGEIAVARSRSEYDELIRERHPAILVDRAADADQADVMISEWGMLTIDDVIEKRIRAVPEGAPIALSDEYPSLRRRIATSTLSGLFMQRCSELEEVVRTPNGTRLTPLASAREDSTVLVPASVTSEKALILADKEFGFGLGADGCRAALEAHRKHLEDQAFNEKLTAIRNAGEVPEKLSLMLDADVLQRGLPAGLVESESLGSGQDSGALRLAELAYNAHDDGVLRAYAKEIRAEFPEAPARFDGGRVALKFVAGLKFPDSFAGTYIPPLPEREVASGPTDFPSLHPYQELIASRFVDLLCSARPQRAMLSLPTGAGKTRVAAEGVIRWIRESGMPDGPILWIAQTTELCEQAVQSWKFVWEKVGAEYPLVIDRLWTDNSATPVSGRPHLVVATDAKLRSCLDTDDYAWLRKASLVIVDEAHVAISKQYTQILDSMGLTHRVTTRHLVGLTATPFRNNEDLTRRLVLRFGDRRLDEGVLGDEPISKLQELGILSKVEHRELAGIDMALQNHELAEVEKLHGFLPRSAERRLAEDGDRNKVIIEEIAALPDGWPVLVFATSVDHAKLLAAKLSNRGIRSVAIDSATPPGDRRQRIDAFRRGEIRVITNYGVLSQGFDAPATRAVLIARPVYSANAYQQMVGRGLRGVKNGGKDSCLILDVRDNITNFDNSLAFTEFEYLWQEDER